MRFNPHYPAYYLFHLGHAYFLTGEYEEAIAALKRVLNRNPDFVPAHFYLAASYSELGQEEEARTHVTELPEGSLEETGQRLPYKDHGVLERLFGALRKVGRK